MASSLVAARAFVACFDWPVGVGASDAGGPDANGVVVGTDASQLDGDASDPSADAGDAAEAGPAKFGCPKNGDGSRTSCFSDSQHCCEMTGTWICKAGSSGCAPSYACASSADCPAASPICCYAGGGGPVLGSTTCESSCIGLVMCDVPSDCIKVDAGMQCIQQAVSSPPPDPYRSCAP